MSGQIADPNMTVMDRNQGKPSWRIRRRIIFSTLIYCAGMSAWGVAQSVEMAAVVLPSMSALATLVIGSYVFGAVWDDKVR